MEPRLTTFLLCILFLAACTAKRKTGKPFNENGGFEISVVELNKEQIVLEEAVAARRPIVYKNSHATQWKATKKWTPSYLKRKIGGMELKVKTSPEQHFYTGCCNTSILTVEEFWRMAENREGVGEYVYYTAPLAAYGAVRRDLPTDGFRSFITADAQYKNYIGDQVWLGAPGATTLMHYDSNHNMYLQIYGRKKFIMLPPEEWGNVYLHPKHSIQHRNIQPNILNPNEDRFPRALYAKPTEVILEPGDVLYVPPCWFHQVEALSTSISFDVYSEARVIERLDSAWGISLPFDFEGWTMTQIVDATSYFLRSLVRKVIGSKGRGRFFDHLLEQYEGIYGESGEGVLEDPFLVVRPSPTNPDIEGFEKFSENVAQYSASMLGERTPLTRRELCSREGDDTGNWMDLERRAKVDKALGEVATIFKETEVQGIKEIYLAGYIDDMAGMLLGDMNPHAFVECRLIPAA